MFNNAHNTHEDNNVTHNDIMAAIENAAGIVNIGTYADDTYTANVEQYRTKGGIMYAVSVSRGNETLDMDGIRMFDEDFSTFDSTAWREFVDYYMSMKGDIEASGYDTSKRTRG